jgi:RimJ/RimL family protein N-acetyltransferase
VERADATAVYAYLNHPDLAGRRCIPWRFPNDAPLSTGQVEAIVERWAGAENALRLIVTRRGSEEPIGHAESDWGWDPHSPSVSVLIAPDHQRQGYGSEALRLLLDYLFDHTPAHSVGCWIADWNHPALRFIEAQGFQEGGCMRRAGIRGGAYFDVILADILRPEWREKRASDHHAGNRWGELGGRPEHEWREEGGADHAP